MSRGIRFGNTASAGVGAPFVPTSTAGCKLWLDAGTLGLADGAAIATWADSSGAGNNAGQATGTLQPIFKVNIFNGKPVVRFDGNDDQMVTASAITFSGGFTLFFVLLLRDVTSDSRLTGHISDLKAIHIRFGGGLIGCMSIYDGSSQFVLLTPALAINTGAIYLFAITWNGAQATSRINGVAQAPVAITGLTWPAASGLGHVYNQAIAINGDIAETILYNVALATPDIQTVETYLKTKYGL